jgi:hypothetical protein
LCIAVGVNLLLTIALYTYFVPEQLAIVGVSSDVITDAELASRAQRWMRLTYVRQPIAVFGLAAAIWAFGLLNQARAHAQ